MAKMSIDLFPFLKQQKADVLPVYASIGTLAISADYLYGFWRIIVRAHTNFKREIKEDI